MLKSFIEIFHLESLIETFALITNFCKWYVVCLIVLLSIITGIVIFVTTYKELRTSIKKRWLVCLLAFVIGLFSGVFAGPIMVVTMFVAPYDF